MDSVDWIVHCLQYAASCHDCPVPSTQAAKDVIGLSIDNAVNTLFPGIDEETRHKLAQDYSQRFFSKNISADDLFPGVPAMLATLKTQGYRLAVATGKRVTGLEKSLTATGTGSLFCTTRSAEQTASKPNPLMIDEIVAELGVSKARTLLVGDSIHDMQLALNAGIAAVGVTCGAHSAKTLQQFKPLLCLDYPTDLMRFL